jgi:hypothetical protein
MFGHNVNSMFALSTTTAALFNALPQEFTKKDFDTVRASMKGAHPLSLPTCREYGFIIIVRTEPATYQVEEDVWVNPITNEQYNNDTLRKKWSVELAEQFGVDYTPYPRIYCLPHSSIKVDKPCVRNIFAVNFEKFQKFLNENS